MRPGQAERRSHDSKRHGTTDLFAAKAGTVIDARKGRHRTSELRAFLDQVEAAVPADLDVHLGLDNAATHKTRVAHERLVKRPRRHLHFTPTPASWLNMVEGWFALLARRCLQRGAFASTDALKAAIHARIDQTNAAPRPFVWTKSTDDILASVKRFCQQTSNSYQIRLIGSGPAHNPALPMAVGERSFRTDQPDLVSDHWNGDASLR